MMIKTDNLTGPALDWAVLEALKPTLKDPSQAYISTFGPLFVAAMRCFVASRFGNEIDVPDVLMV